MMKTTTISDSATQADMADVRAKIEREFSPLVVGHPHVLQLALNEAEAIASQTAFPELLFPSLALEKAQTVAHWHRRQESLRAMGSVLAFAA